MSFEVLNKFPALFIRKGRPVFGAAMTAVGVTGPACVEQEQRTRGLERIAQLLGIIFPVTHGERLDAPFGRQEQLIEAGDRAIVKIGWGGPDTRQGAIGVALGEVGLNVLRGPPKVLVA